MKLRPYVPGDWERLCAIHDAARRDDLRTAGLDDAFLTLEATAGNEKFAASGYVLQCAASEA